MDTKQPWGLRFNDAFEKYLFLITPASLMLGFLFYPVFDGFVSWVPWLFAFITFTMGMGVGLKQFREVARMPLSGLLLFALIHVLAPLAAYWGGNALFGEGSPFVVGLVLFTVIPLGVSSVIWIGMSGGGVAFALSMIVIDSALSPVVVPFLIEYFFGTTLEFDKVGVMIDMLKIIVVPTLLGVLVYELSRGRAKPAAAPYILPVSKLAFSAVIVINAAAIAPYAFDLKSHLLKLVPACVGLVLFCYATGALFARLRSRDRGYVMTFSYLSGMRNISLGIVLALSYFEPLAAVPVVLSILIQQPAATVAQVVFRRLGWTRKESSTV
ncbi:bile acid:sodium symporter family protein [Paenibacillus thermoaerophilus]|uniref:Bile acid:sodium symporter family protein n=1 Tax=Paenibacillus thermoaerophilus TaxID=1215385 RepID=A0ABW2V1M3_9BACL|nr:bile acid:sodium symporter family protein [Paenibacillus thermoaerophilus]TMV15995.1 bile acid:sodium symporter family protein [Paenibacillus thermoaerophilus]